MNYKNLEDIQFLFIPLEKRGRPVLTESFTFEGNQNYTVAAVDELNKLDLLFIYDGMDVPSGETKLRFVHLSPDAPAVDIAARGGDVIFSGVQFKEVTKYLPLSPMHVQLSVRKANQKCSTRNPGTEPSSESNIYGICRRIC